MAHEPPVGRVVSEVDGAPGAGGHLAALPTAHHPAGAPAVEQQNGLLPPGGGIRQGPGKHAAQVGAVAGAQFPLHIHDLYRGQRPLIVPLFQGKQLVGALPGLVHGLNGRGGRGQQQQSLVLDTAELGHVPGVVLGHVF